MTKQGRGAAGLRRIWLYGTIGYWLLAIPYAAVAVIGVYRAGPPPAHPFTDIPIIVLTALALVSLPYLAMVGLISVIRWAADGFQTEGPQRK